ncbi:hypothetical protein [Hymenobacter latericus]|uniref:hypothetical protein n=1 Tax=Hymenobacter sp. YIM 151858-1 TaxID=2987688 RepID=UPI0022279543|nr:hypothetical protein [Hymenobacter sp. YIM 151858-1]UYZ58512.1 hypothetical protein OIS50_15800 [Hymenobacter sp. YIM 151858-1]
MLLLAPALLGSCGGADPSPAPFLDFISEGTLLTNTRATTPGDTFRTRTFAEVREKQRSPKLRRFSIGVQYSVRLNNQEARVEEPERLYLDTLISGRDFFLFSNRLKTSNISGRETWTYRVEDAEGQTTRRSYVLTVRQPDSIRTWLSYSARLEPSVRRTSLAAVATSRGLVLPAHATDARGFQELIDLVYVPNGTAPTLASPTAPAAETAPNLKVRSWATRRNTGLQLTALTPASFNQINSDVAITAAVAAAGNRVGSLRVQKDQVLAFRTADNKDGLLLVREVGTVSPIAVVLDVKVNR